jgi:hypothetical protein
VIRIVRWIPVLAFVAVFGSIALFGDANYLG